MKVISSGHEYELDSCEGGAPQTIKFINKKPALNEKELQKCHADAVWEASGSGILPESAIDQIGDKAVAEARAKLVTIHDGTTNEEVLAMLIDRMGYLQGLCPCRENAIVVTKLEEALMWLNKRTAERKARNVEGTHIA